MRLNTITSLLNLSEYIRIEEVLAVPETPISMAALLQMFVAGCFKIASKRIVALKESRVGIKV